jgi:hypothetical protein
MKVSFDVTYDGCDLRRFHVQLVRALEKNWMSRRLLLWRHQREAADAQRASQMIHHERETMDECVLALQAARDSAVAQATTAEVALSEARSGLQTTLLEHSASILKSPLHSKFM